jgi:hypothetical protein
MGRPPPPRVTDRSARHRNAEDRCCAVAELGGAVEFREIRTDDRDVFLEWGITDALFIDGKEVRNGPPPKFDKIKKKIARRVKRL